MKNLKLLAAFASILCFASCVENDQIRGPLEQKITPRSSDETEFQGVAYDVRDSTGFVYCMIPSGDHEWRPVKDTTWYALQGGDEVTIWCDCLGAGACLHIKDAGRIRCKSQTCSFVCDMRVEIETAAQGDTTLSGPIIVRPRE
ncbi:MAG: hypothetical protein DRI69_06215 [Bacteroidetes bacterium]|nr:MAG: hypothetical protein DRI69_06215 [Bacteroidota bacterium]